MKDPLLEYRKELTSISDIRTRIKQASKILSHLTLVESEFWRSLYRLELDGSYWMQEFPFSELHGGGGACIYLFESENPLMEFKTRVSLVDKIKANERDLNFWNDLGEEIGPQVCKAESCGKLSIKMSAYCRTHHYEMLKNVKCPFED